jgi:hypothetical protein
MRKGDMTCSPESGANLVANSTFSSPSFLDMLDAALASAGRSEEPAPALHAELATARGGPKASSILPPAIIHLKKMQTVSLDTLERAS